MGSFNKALFGIMSCLVFLWFASCVCIDYSSPTEVPQPTKPFQHVYTIVIKEKFIINDLTRFRYLLRYYNKTTNEHYIMEDYDTFVKFDIGETLIFLEKHDGASYTNRLTRAGKHIKAEAAN